VHVQHTILYRSALLGKGYIWTDDILIGWSNWCIETVCLLRKNVRHVLVDLVKPFSKHMYKANGLRYKYKSSMTE